MDFKEYIGSVHPDPDSLNCKQFEDFCTLAENYAKNLNTPKYYDNSKGTIYKVAQERGWNPYVTDVVKRLERAEKKGEYNLDTEKSIGVIKLYQAEQGHRFKDDK